MTALVWGHCNQMATSANNTANPMSNATVRKGAQSILAKTGTITQVLKQLKGTYSEKLWKSKDVPKNCENMTVGEYFAAMGVQRFVSDKGKVGDITPGTLAAGWNAGLKNDDAMCVFRNVKGVYVDKAGKKHNVYTAEEGARVDGKAISQYTLVSVAPTKWSINVILRGLMQGYTYEKEEKKMLDSQLDFANMEKVYIRKEDADGHETLELIEVSKDDVKF